MSALPTPPIVSLADWQDALAAQKTREEALHHHQREVEASRRRLPMTPVAEQYRFHGAEGELSFAELFQGAHQLVVYHFMFAADWENGCPFCTRYMLELGYSFDAYLRQRDTRFVLISRAPHDSLQAYASRRGITVPWYTGSREFATEMQALDPQYGDVAGFSVFFRDDADTVYRSFRTSEFSEIAVVADQLLLLTPYGRQYRGEDSPTGWPQAFEEYIPVDA